MQLCSFPGVVPLAGMRSGLWPSDVDAGTAYVFFNDPVLVGALGTALAGIGLPALLGGVDRRDAWALRTHG